MSSTSFPKTDPVELTVFARSTLLSTQESAPRIADDEIGNGANALDCCHDPDDGYGVTIDPSNTPVTGLDPVSPGTIVSLS
jgi:hypothetical protein